MDIIIKELSYVYHQGTPFERKVLEDVHVTMKAGSFTAIIGQTGSGKSTFIQHLNGILKPYTGSIRLGDYEINAKQKKSALLYEQVGMVFQYPEHQLFEETVYKDVAFGPKNLGWPEELVHNRVLQALRLVGLDESILERSPFQLSGGQKRRVAIAGVLAMQPKVLVLDEPTAGLDPQGREELMQTLLHWKEEKRSIIYVTHDMDDVAEFADEVIVFHQGKVLFQEQPYTLFTKYASRLQEIGLAVPDAVSLIQQLNERLSPPIVFQSVQQEHILQQIADYFRKRDQR